MINKEKISNIKCFFGFHNISDDWQETIEEEWPINENGGHRWKYVYTSYCINCKKEIREEE